MKKLLGKLKEQKAVKKLLAVFGTSLATVSALVVSTGASQTSTDPILVGEVLNASMFQGILNQIYSVIPHVLPVMVTIIGIILAVSLVRRLLHW